MVSRPVYCRRFIGRRAQLELLAERQRDALEGRGSLVLLSGEAGIGKSRLIEQANEAFKRASGEAALGRCYQYVQAPYAPFADLLRALEILHPDVLAASSALKLAVSPLLDDAFSGATQRVANDDEKRRLFDGVADALRAFSTRAPLLLTIEDIHWADDGTLELLQHVAPTLDGTRIVLVCTYRSEEVRQRQALRSALATLQVQTNVWRIELEPLGAAEVRELIAYSVEDNARSAIAEVADSVCRLADGNPFFAEEILKNALDASAGGARELPLSVSQAVIERAAGLAEGERYILDCASLLDRDFTPGFLARIAERTENEVFAAIKSAIGFQLLIEDARGDVRYAFRHAITREVLRSELLAAEQRALHAKIAQIVETSPQSRERDADLAYHYYEARNVEKASQYNALAADAAAQLGAYDDAARCYERALEGIQEADRRAPIYERLAHTLYQRGWAKRARAAYEEAIRLFEAVDDVASATRVRIAFARDSYALGESATTFEQLRRALETCEAHIRGGPLHFTVLATLGGMSALVGRVDEAFDYLDRAERLTGERERESEEAFFGWRCVAQGMRGKVRESELDCARAVEIARNEGDELGACRWLGNFGDLMRDSGERNLSLAAFDEALKGFRASPAGGALYGWLLLQYAESAFYFGELRAARSALGDLPLLPSTISFNALLTATALPLGIALEDWELVERYADLDLLESVFALEPQRYEFYASLAGRLGSAFARLMEHRGDTGAARRILARSLDAISRMALVPVNDPWIFVQAAGIGDVAITTQAQELFARVAASSVRGDIGAHVCLLKALRRGPKDGAEGREAFALEGSALFAERSVKPRQAFALEMAGKRREAFDLYREIGDVHEAHRLERALTPVNRRGRPKTALTAREQDVAKLLAEGKSNRAIADTLVVGERTVETHVASILAKLGARSRAEAAALLSARTPPESIP